MLEINISAVKTFFSRKSYSASVVNSLFKKIKEKREESIDLLFGESRKKRLYLVILEGDPLGAFYIEGNVYRAVSGRDFFNLIETLPDISLSYYGIDPVFAKCLLTPAQNKPVYQGEINENEVKKRIDLIQSDREENIILLKDQNEINYFYFKHGKGVGSYFFHPDKKPSEKEIGEQFLMYVLSRDPALLTMELYHNAQVVPLLENMLMPEDLSEGIVAYFQKQKPRPTSAEKMDFEVDPAPGNDTGASSTKNGKGKWYLELVGGEQMGRRLVLNKRQLTIGRMKADLMLGDVKISREHALIEATDQGFRFTDLGSTNGSFINGQPVKTQLLKAGDIIRLGGTLIKLLAE